MLGNSLTELAEATGHLETNHEGQPQRPHHRAQLHPEVAIPHRRVPTRQGQKASPVPLRPGLLRLPRRQPPDLRQVLQPPPRVRRRQRPPSRQARPALEVPPDSLLHRAARPRTAPQGRQPLRDLRYPPSQTGRPYAEALHHLRHLRTPRPEPADPADAAVQTQDHQDARRRVGPSRLPLPRQGPDRWEQEPPLPRVRGGRLHAAGLGGGGGRPEEPERDVRGAQEPQPAERGVRDSVRGRVDGQRGGGGLAGELGGASGGAAAGGVGDQASLHAAVPAADEREGGAVLADAERGVAGGDDVRDGGGVA